MLESEIGARQVLRQNQQTHEKDERRPRTGQPSSAPRGGAPTADQERPP